MYAKLKLKVVPRASRTEVVERQGDIWRVRLKAPPVDGKANAELIKFLSKLFKTPKNTVEILAGASGKLKTVRVEDLAQHQVEALMDAELEERK